MSEHDDRCGFVYAETGYICYDIEGDEGVHEALYGHAFVPGGRALVVDDYTDSQDDHRDWITKHGMP